MLMMLLLLTVLPWPLALSPHRAAAAEPLFSSSSGSPVAITSDTLEIDQKGGRAVFRGNVEAQQDSTRLTAGIMTVIFTPENNEVAEIIAEKKVTITLNGKLATCGRAHYFAADERLELTGDPAIKEKNNVIRGTKIVFFLREERSVIEGKQDTRVKTTIYPGSGGLFNAPADR
jgi:lipopolysaccharide export system protein LptA